MSRRVPAPSPNGGRAYVIAFTRTAVFLVLWGSLIFGGPYLWNWAKIFENRSITRSEAAHSAKSDCRGHIHLKQGKDGSDPYDYLCVPTRR